MTETTETADGGTREFNAVFKGGGAKGIAYAGALQACFERKIDFVEVAGSSAGAITAMLVACGYQADAIVKEMPTALGSIGSVPRSLAMIGGRPSLLSSDRLHTWLCGAIERSIPGITGAECTFADIARDHGRKLYVITLDLATRQPRVFSPDLTPDTPVADAVVASSAIPVAFPSVRMTVDDSVHRLVDGGTWANYPAFVFHDEDFRQYHGLGPNTRPTLGFILDEADDADDARAGDAAVTPEVQRPWPSPRRERGGRLIGDKGSVTDQLEVPGAILSSPMFRWLAALLPLMFVVLSLMWIRDEMQRPDPWIGRLPEWSHEVALVAAVAILSITGIIALVMSIAIARLGRSLFDSGIVGAMAAIGVGPSVAYWVGHGDNHHTAVRIVVPTELKTLSFDADAETQSAALAKGYTAARVELAKLACLGGPSTAPGPLAAAPVAHAGRPDGMRTLRWLFSSTFGRILSRVFSAGRWLARTLERNRWLRLGAVAYALIAGTGAAFSSFESFARDRNLVGLMWLGVVGSATALGAWLLANGRHNEATRRTPYPRFGKRSATQLRLVGWSSLAVAAVVVLGYLFNGEASIVTASRAAPVTGVVRAIENGGDGTVVVEIDDLDLAATLLGVEVIDALQQLDIDPAAGLDDDDLDTFFDKTFDDGLTDLYGEEVEIVDAPDDTTTFAFATDREPAEAVGDDITVRADLERNRLFLDQDVWDGGRGRLTIQLMVVASLVFLGFGLRALRAARWKTQANPAKAAASPSARRATTDLSTTSPKTKQKDTSHA